VPLKIQTFAIVAAELTGHSTITALTLITTYMLCVRSAYSP